MFFYVIIFAIFLEGQKYISVLQTKGIILFIDAVQWFLCKQREKRKEGEKESYCQAKVVSSQNHFQQSTGSEHPNGFCFPSVLD